MFDTPYNIDERPRSWYRSPIITPQIEWELYALMVEFQKINPRYILELGTMCGGTLFHMISQAKDTAVFVAVDWGQDKWVPPGDFDNSVWWDWLLGSGSERFS